MNPDSLRIALMTAVHDMDSLIRHSEASRESEKIAYQRAVHMCQDSIETLKKLITEIK